MQNRFRRSNLELRRPRKGLEIGTRHSRGVRSAPFSRTDSESADELGDRGGPRSRNCRVTRNVS
eukprot:15478460-Alexandrium_andersonii.AAC.1